MPVPQKSTGGGFCTEGRENVKNRGLDAAVTFAILLGCRYCCAGSGGAVSGFQTYEVRLVTNTG